MMVDKQWVYEHISKLFDTDIVKEGATLRNSKLDYINLPLYKYCYVCEDASKK